ncbi:SDR family oxidoreductase [Alphaproteobacteria bacterium]
MAKAFITGGAKRMGKVISLFLARQGWDIILHYNTSKDEAIELAHQIRQLGRDITLLQADFAQKDELGSVLEALSNVEDIHLLVNNAAVFINDNFENTKYDGLVAHLQINVVAPIILAQHLLGSAKNTLNVNIINILDYTVFQIQRNFFSYNLSKRILYDYTKLTSLQAAPHARINGISLGQVMQNPKQKKEDYKLAISSTPLQCGGTTRELCNTIQFILQTPSLTGQVFTLDGGAHLEGACTVKRSR